ncbi:MAG: 50S ribosomal protein L5 [Candidatus Magasanikbacteria bacterium CG_4_9_14_0_2_um_filter_41_10]|uniref:Large ribosomal subunit protein uL5 n=1 Tax=Candidatus Magasanikbacteria bacterium CG_4_10_14_0_2_um_filter_41_31 TaxID=1974639 RepID=A0A2M7V663_9BACT|nr:MAG: 50S ribosomal protein L5 [Candidatus Magasanikbacteria bacterium CG1_02_41_34]PIZ94120.1 MAG: 50S ribosomal protein L5 [Candidatus Magasanikbacteria bacterium CG_4_10_14_0_2_um_filter_41_31]PJC53873.1 MAG: 50S ribosomal protein L5 [Candidatus Magasanikbacteria bacterium CG_4_9_14_0_2_um_filter_41_10]
MTEPTLYTQYKTTVVPALKVQFGYKNVMEVPRIEKVVLNVGYGRHVKDKQYIEQIEKTLTQITGQKPVHNKSRKAISNFKIREGMNIGVSVTLRGRGMYEFLNKLIHVTFPRVRDFRGINPKSFDPQGNYAIGFKENIAFPEIGGDAIERMHGLEVIVTTTASNRAEGFALLKGLGFPFRDK